MPPRRQETRPPIKVVLQLLMAQRKMSPARLAAEADFSPSSYARAMKGSAGPDVYVAIDGAFGLPEFWLWAVATNDLETVRAGRKVPKVVMDTAIREMTRSSVGVSESAANG